MTWDGTLRLICHCVPTPRLVYKYCKTLDGSRDYVPLKEELWPFTRMTVSLGENVEWILALSWEQFLWGTDAMWSSLMGRSSLHRTWEPGLGVGSAFQGDFLPAGPEITKRWGDDVVSPKEPPGTDWWGMSVHCKASTKLYKLGKETTEVYLPTVAPPNNVTVIG